MEPYSSNAVQVEQQDVENGLYSHVVMTPSQQRIGTQRQQSIDMEEIPLNNLHQETENKHRIHQIFAHVRQR